MKRHSAMISVEELDEVRRGRAILLERAPMTDPSRGDRIDVEAYDGTGHLTGEWATLTILNAGYPHVAAGLCRVGPQPALRDYRLPALPKGEVRI